MIVELTQMEGDLLRTLLENHIAVADKGIVAVAVAGKLEDAGAKVGTLNWHVNHFNHIHIYNFNN